MSTKRMLEPKICDPPGKPAKNSRTKSLKAMAGVAIKSKFIWKK